MLVEIAGSHGELTVDSKTGEIVNTVAGCEDGCLECGYKDGGQAYPFIIRFDPKTIHSHSDIITVGYWYKDGCHSGYEPAQEPVT